MNVTQQTQSEKKRGAFSDTVSVIIQALLLAVVVRTLLFQPFTIPSGSMLPNLLVGDYLFVSKYTYGYSRYSLPWAPNLFSGRVWAGEPERGDIAVFKLPRNPSIDYIKRLIGLPGDRIQMVDGILHINGEPVRRERRGTWTPEHGGPAIPVYVETLPNGVSYETLDLTPRSEGDNTPVFEVPPGHYFFMGDNRDNSLDSRFDVGYVPYENLVGPARVIFFSVDNNSHPLAFWNWPSDMRWGRLFKIP
ncbi:MAG: signal peptidase I [Alphaproteobacteria bacterium]|nr:MAG: signal peptidase I [Alphaproteobacteria bacterium]